MGGRKYYKGGEGSRHLRMKNILGEIKILDGLTFCGWQSKLWLGWNKRMKLGWWCLTHWLSKWQNGYYRCLHMYKELFDTSTPCLLGRPTVVKCFSRNLYVKGSLVKSNFWVIFRVYNKCVLFFRILFWRPGSSGFTYCFLPTIPGLCW